MARPYTPFPNNDPILALKEHLHPEWASESIGRPSIQAYEDFVLQNMFTTPTGFVRLVDYMGSEDSIVRAARVSYGKGTKTRSEDSKLIQYLLSHEHTTPFEHVNLAFHIKCPIFVWRQWIRQRTASVNEMSGRYSELPTDFANYREGEWRLQSSSNKQGSQGAVNPETGTMLTRLQDEANAAAKKAYEACLAAGVAKEQARTMLPVSTMTEAYWEIDLHNLLRWLSQRQDQHAQEEIRAYANVIAAIVAIGFPSVWQAHCKFDIRKDAVKLSRPQLYTMLNTDPSCYPFDLSKSEQEYVDRLLNDYSYEMEYVDRLRLLQDSSDEMNNNDI